MVKVMAPLRKVLSGLCLVGLALVIGYSVIFHMLKLSVLRMSVKGYLAYNTSSCDASAHQTAASMDASQQKAPIFNITLACNCSNTSIPTYPPSPLQAHALHDDTTLTQIKQWHANKFWHEPNTFPLCSMDSCFNLSHCADMEQFRMYAYGPPYEPISYLKSLDSTQWLTTDPSQACLFLVTEPNMLGKARQRPHPSTLPHWNGGLNHVIATIADKWSLTGPPPHTIGNASVLASCLQETTYRAGFDISIPLPGRTHVVKLQKLKPWSRKYFLTFRGTRYLGGWEGNFRSDPAFRSMHNGRDVIVAVTCRQVSNDRVRKEHPEAGEGCDADEVRFKQYNFRQLMNSTFGLAPAGRSPSSYRLIETMSAGAIPVLIADNYVKPFESLIQWHQCLLQFPTREVARILPVLRALSREEVERRQRYCLFIYKEYLKDDATLVRSVVTSLKLRFYGTIPQFMEAVPTAAAKEDG